MFSMRLGKEETVNIISAEKVCNLLVQGEERMCELITVDLLMVAFGLGLEC